MISNEKKNITELNPAQNTLFPDLNPIKENDLKLNIRAKRRKKREQPSLKIIILVIYFQNKQKILRHQLHHSVMHTHSARHVRTFILTNIIRSQKKIQHT